MLSYYIGKWTTNPQEESIENRGNRTRENGWEDLSYDSFSPIILSLLMRSWSHLGLNQGLPDYESGALTDWAIGPKRVCRCMLFLYRSTTYFCHAKVEIITLSSKSMYFHRMNAQSYQHPMRKPREVIWLYKWGTSMVIQGWGYDLIMYSKLC